MRATILGTVLILMTVPTSQAATQAPWIDQAQYDRPTYFTETVFTLPAAAPGRGVSPANGAALPFIGLAAFAWVSLWLGMAAPRAGRGGHGARRYAARAALAMSRMR